MNTSFVKLVLSVYPIYSAVNGVCDVLTFVYNILNVAPAKQQYVYKHAYHIYPFQILQYSKYDE